MKTLMMAAALVTLVSAPAFAQSPVAQRDAAIRDCNAVAAKSYPIRDSNWPVLSYRACMAQHGQVE